MPRAQITHHFGAFPEMEHNPLELPSGPTWHWWLCAVLPLDPRAQLAILAMNSLKERLKALQRVLNLAKRQSMVSWLGQAVMRVVLYSRTSLFLTIGIAASIGLGVLETLLEQVLMWEEEEQAGEMSLEIGNSTGLERTANDSYSIWRYDKWEF